MADLGLRDRAETVWIATEMVDFQGQELLGIYTTREAAEERVKDVRPSQRDVREIPLDTPINEWMGN